ncbi:hypothetical protein Pth03_78490 [Planotetraspora thailandica]|uniref:Asp23/Gls24 family envelope stress response protein n=1 Tax=Planotetraspora thailandica TaxID=487172 RepID=A0A8J4DFQ7_9ACTN|nr:Asp23/Gls24 family envelope stress response protein [Planotetraspora thailandica]GII59460.1 hypothetical protein Pth03_78490 [Planotetraspora thailandica]
MSGGLAGQVAERARACPQVEELSSGPFGTIATYLPGESVPGVAVRDDEIEIHVIARYGPPLPEVGTAVREAVGDLAGDRRVNVTIDDVRTHAPAAKPAKKPAKKKERRSS